MLTLLDVAPFDHRIERGGVPPELKTMALPSFAPKQVILVGITLLTSNEGCGTLMLTEVLHPFASDTGYV